MKTNPPIFKGEMGNLYGTPVIVNDTACISEEMRQFRFPKSKKKRIVKKWGKRPENLKLTKVDRIIKVEGRLIMSEKTFNRIKESQKI